MTAASPRRWLRDNAAWLCVCAAAMVVFPYFAALNNPNENARVWATRAIVAHGTFAIDEVERVWGETSDRAAANGHRYSSKAPGTTLAGVPVHWVHDRIATALGAPPSPRATTLVLRLFTVALPLAFFFCLFGRRVERETGSTHARDLLVIALGLGTMMYTYALGFAGHAQAAALAFGAYVCLLDARRSTDPKRLLLGGALAGLAVLFEYQALLVAIALAAFAAVEHRQRCLYFLAGALGPAAILGAYHTALFGAPWAFPYGALDDPGYQEFHTAGFFGLAAPRARTLAKIIYSADYGLLFFSPFLALGVAGAVHAILRGLRRDGVLVLAIGVAMTLFVAGMSNWRGGWCAAGPRYLAVAVPFVAWGVVLAWRPLFAQRRTATALLVTATLVSVGACVLASAVFPHWPLQFTNPLFEVSLRLVREGYAPYGLGSLLGLGGLAAYLPLAALLVVASWLVLSSLGGAALRVACLAGAALALVAMGLPRRHTTTEKERTFEFVRTVFEPKAGADGAP